MLLLMGHMNTAMLKRYSHIRMSKRDAVAAVTMRRRKTADSSADPDALSVKLPVAPGTAIIQ
jgi:hypothetical protein